jgi:hypothetical protein
MTVARHPGSDLDRPDVPLWAVTLGAVVALILGGLVVQTFTGRSLVSRVAALLPGSHSEQLAAGDTMRALYTPGSTVRVGQVAIGARGQDRAFQPDDTVLLGATGQLVRLGGDGRLT